MHERFFDTSGLVLRIRAMVYSSKDSESLWFLYLVILNGMLTIEEEEIKLQFMSCEDHIMDQRVPPDLLV